MASAVERPGEGGDLAHALVGEQILYREGDAGGAEQADGADGAHGVAAEPEEAVVAADLVDAEGGTQGVGDGLLQVAVRRDVPAAARAGVVRCRKCPAVDLAAAVQRQRVEQRPPGGDHRVGQPFAQERADLVEVGGGDQVRGELPVVHGHGGLGDAGAVTQNRLDLAGFDALTGDLDLPVEAAEELDGAVGPVAGQVPGAVEPLPGPGREGVGHEPVGGQRGAAEVAAGELDAADHQLTGYADRLRPERPVEDVGAGVGDRPSDGDRLGRVRSAVR
nr:hypothetical protein GCM10020092_035220 [Actinoplanes digitatis]